MSSIQSQEYLRTCAQLASCLSISIAAAKKKVEIAASAKGVKDIKSRHEVAQLILSNIMKSKNGNLVSNNSHLDELLEALAEEENFLVED